MNSLPKRITAKELSLILNVNEETIKQLHKTNQIPGRYINKRLYFDFEELMSHFAKIEGGAA